MILTAYFQESLLELTARDGDFEVYRSNISLNEKTDETWTSWSTRYQSASSSINPVDVLALGYEIFEWLIQNDKGLLDKIENSIGDIALNINAQIKMTERRNLFLTIPWEILAIKPENEAICHLAQSEFRLFRIIRRIGAAQKTPIKPRFRDLTTLFMSASARGQSHLNYELEEAAILKATRGLQLHLLVEDSGNIRELSKRLAQEGDVQALHISCHGGMSETQPLLSFETDSGNEELVTAGQFSHAVGETKPLLLFLSACQTDSYKQVIDSYCLSLIRGQFQNVLGWGGSVKDHDATIFASYFYEQIVLGRTTDYAVAVARQKCLQAHLKSSNEMPHWHLARLYCGPGGGGSLIDPSMTMRRATNQASYNAFKQRDKEYLDKVNSRVPVTPPELFVGRREPLKSAIRELRRTDDKSNFGISLIGMGHHGKSSLAARIASRFSTYKSVVLYKNFDFSTIFQALYSAIPAAHRYKWQDLEAPQGVQIIDKRFLQNKFEELLNGPFSNHDPSQDKQPILLILDDLESVLSKPSKDDDKAYLLGESKDVIEAILMAFDATQSNTQSRLIITSRYVFSLINSSGQELSGLTALIEVPHMADYELEKQFRQALYINDQDLSSFGKDDFEVITKARKVARGNPGLHEVLTRPFVTQGRGATEDVKRAIEAISIAWQGGDVPDDQTQIIDFLTRVSLDAYREGLSETEMDVLRACSVVEYPVTMKALHAMAKSIGVEAPERPIQKLRNLGLIDAYFYTGETIEGMVTPIARTPGFLEALSEEDISQISRYAAIEILEAARYKISSLQNFEARYGITAEQFWKSLEGAITIPISQKLQVAAASREPGLSPEQISALIHIFKQEKQYYQILLDYGVASLASVVEIAFEGSDNNIPLGLKLIITNFENHLSQKELKNLNCLKGGSKADYLEWAHRISIERDPNFRNYSKFANFLHELDRNNSETEHLYRLAEAVAEVSKHDSERYEAYLQEICDNDSDKDIIEEAKRRYFAAEVTSLDIANTIGNFALFMHKMGEDNEETERLYKAAEATGSASATTLGNFALFMHNTGEDNEETERLYKAAEATGSASATTLGNFALFMKTIREDYEEAERLFKAAEATGSASATTLGNFALFMHKMGEDNEETERLYKAAEATGSASATTLGNFALLMHKMGEDNEETERLYKAAEATGSADANTLGNFAIFMHFTRENYEEAERLYKAAEATDSVSANTLGNYAGLLFWRGKKVAALSYLERAEGFSSKEKDLQIELAFYRFAHCPEFNLQPVKRLLLDGARSPGFDLMKNAKRASKDGHPNPELVVAIAKVIEQGSNLEGLEEIAGWTV